jgi:hypothetical protein
VTMAERSWRSARDRAVQAWLTVGPHEAWAVLFRAGWRHRWPEFLAGQQRYARLRYLRAMERASR